MGDNWQSALSKVQAKTLFLPASGDQLLLPEMAKASAEALRAAGKTVEYAEIPGIWGHLDGVVGINAVAENIRSFLATE
jgi:homoserine O-acetyltransferase